MQTEFEKPPQIVEKWRELGFAEETLELLPLVPAVQVAWAEGFLQAAERRTILRIFEQLGANDDASFKVLLEWLDERPSDEFFATATEVLSDWLTSISSPQAAVLRDFLHACCLEVANASTTIGLPTGKQTICREEKRQLELIGNRLGFTLA